MAHEIASIGGQDAIAYLDESPWHRLGVKMNEQPFLKGESEVQRAMRLSRTDYTVSLADTYLEDGRRVTLRRAVLRHDPGSHGPGEIIASVGSDYHLLQNSEAFGVLNRACLDHGVRITVAGALGKGERAWMLAKLPDSVEPVRGDKVDGYFLIINGHNAWVAYQAMPTAVRVVCANTLAAALAAGQAPVRLFHRESDLKNMDSVAKLVTKMTAALKKTGETFAKLADKKMSFAELGEYVTSVLGIDDETSTTQQDNRRQKILELAEHGRGTEFAPGTAWNAFNAVTEYVDHFRSPNLKPKSLRGADQSALFGPTARLKARALKLALAA